MDLGLILYVIGSLAIGSVAGFYGHKRVMEKREQDAKALADRIIEEARKEAQAQKKEVLLQGQDEVFKNKKEFEQECKDREREIKKRESKLLDKEERLEDPVGKGCPERKRCAGVGKKSDAQRKTAGRQERAAGTHD